MQLFASMQLFGCMRASKDDGHSISRHPSRLARHSALKTRVNALYECALAPRDDGASEQRIRRPA